jgi:hypothetical protein
MNESMEENCGNIIRRWKKILKTLLGGERKLWEHDD